MFGPYEELDLRIIFHINMFVFSPIIPADRNKCGIFRVSAQ